jgi:hypothetical protein
MRMVTPGACHAAITLLGSLSRAGLDAVMTINGLVDTAVFRAYLTSSPP